MKHKLVAEEPKKMQQKTLAPTLFSSTYEEWLRAIAVRSGWTKKDWDACYAALQEEYK